MIDFNTESQSQLSLIFFEDAIDHICRIARVLNQPAGHLMLIGSPGSGKQSLTKLGAFIHEAKCSSIKISKNYKAQNFREEIQGHLLDSGCERRHAVFLLADTQIIDEQFLEDVNGILNTGEIAEPYPKEGTDRMGTDLAAYMKQQGIPQSADNIYKTFIKQIKKYFHVVLSMSPVGDLLRNRCRNFPALVNCCTLDWFDNWPEEALRTVSKQYFREHGLIGDSVAVRDQVLELFPRIHRMVEELSG